MTAIGQAITNATVPVRAVISGSPVLAARLWAPAADRFDKAAEERETIAKARAAARAAELAKLTDEKAIAAANRAHAEADKALRSEKRGRIGDVAGGAALVALVAGPVTWSLVGPWVPVAVWSGVGLWCVAAMMHAPRPGGEEPAAKTAPEDQFTVLRQAVIDQLQEWMAERPGIHLSEVYERYRELPGHEHLTDDQIRASLVDHYRIPTRRAVNDPRRRAQRTRVGIHRDDLQPLPSPADPGPDAEPDAPPVNSDVAA